MTKFNLIVAVSMDGVIGHRGDNVMPWHIPEDLKHFRELTLNNTVIMGSTTFKSIGKTLPNRRNIVLTRDLNYQSQLVNEHGVDECYNSLASALKNETGNIWVIGGEFVYNEAIRLVPTNLYVTLVDSKVVQIDGDVFFKPGRRFMHDIVTLDGTSRYTLESRSKWYSQNDYVFQFTKFTKQDD